MDNATRFIDTIHVVGNELEDLQKRLDKLTSVVQTTAQNLLKGDIRDKESRIEKISEVKVALDELQSFLTYGVNMPLPEQYGALTAFHAMLEDKEDEVWIVKATSEQMSAAQTVDRLTDAIADYLTLHKDDANPPKDEFVDNPDAFVANFVTDYLDHAITDRMSDMVISLVSDWMSFRLA